MMLSKEGKKELAKIQKMHIDPDGDPYSNEDDDMMRAGATCNVCLITKTEIFCANLGDTRSVMSKKQKMKELSFDHKPNNPNEKKRIERANGFVSEDNRVNGMLALSRAVGDFEYKNNPILTPENQIVTAAPDITVEKLSSDVDFIIMACDGIWDCMSSQEAVTFVQSNLKSRKASENLSTMIGDLFEQIVTKDALSSGGIGADNMSCIIIEFKK